MITKIIFVKIKVILMTWNISVWQIHHIPLKNSFAAYATLQEVSVLHVVIVWEGIVLFLTVSFTSHKTSSSQCAGKNKAALLEDLWQHSDATGNTIRPYYQH